MNAKRNREHIRRGNVIPLNPMLRKSIDYQPRLSEQSGRAGIQRRRAGSNTAAVVGWQDTMVQIRKV
jgi:hypothetical protein